MKCKPCDGTGKVRCESCSGEGVSYGRSKCTACGGDGLTPCGVCKGNGKVGFFQWLKKSG
ncbi:hypothetical protein [Paenibacillus sp.]|uniref:hypothetical protein n=1 Tax=Paenibacillus sp. TaxID=58172 RepID=UPI002D29B93A|nr:hypothetical protein [Paenibacillus sp.]HZG54903.1 hypothetical protein [Paenibacillus sp.]